MAFLPCSDKVSVQDCETVWLSTLKVSYCPVNEGLPNPGLEHETTSDAERLKEKNNSPLQPIIISRMSLNRKATNPSEYYFNHRLSLRQLSKTYPKICSPIHVFESCRRSLPKCWLLVKFHKISKNLTLESEGRKRFKEVDAFSLVSLFL